MEIAIIGAGNQGSALGSALARSGHHVIYGVAHPKAGAEGDAGPHYPVADAVRRAEVVAITVPSWHLEEALREVARGVPAGKIVIDVTNPLTPEKDWAHGSDGSNAELVQRTLTGARVVKAFNTVFASWLNAGGRAFGEQLSGFVASDDADAKRTVLGLVARVGLDPIDAGPLASARLLEAAGVMLVRFGAFTPLGWEIGLRVVHPKTTAPAP